MISTPTATTASVRSKMSQNMCPPGSSCHDLPLAGLVLHIRPMNVVLGIIGGLTFAILFYKAAEYEHMTAWKWAVASLAVSVTVRGLFPLSFIFLLPAQFGLFLIFWWMNTRHKAERERERTTAASEDRRVRQERLQRQREQAAPDDAARQAAQAARDEAALRERQERVRRARAEREEREQAARGKPPSGQ
jgi:hypothetical protein